MPSLRSHTQASLGSAGWFLSEGRRLAIAVSDDIPVSLAQATPHGPSVAVTTGQVVNFVAMEATGVSAGRAASLLTSEVSWISVNGPTCTKRRHDT